MRNSTITRMRCGVPSMTIVTVLFSFVTLWMKHWSFGSRRPANERLRNLLDPPDVISTTKPHIRVSSGLEIFDGELERGGFYPNQAQHYLKAIVEDQAQVLTIQTFPPSRPLDQGIVRIRIQLDAPCFTCDNLWNLNGNSD